MGYRTIFALDIKPWNDDIWKKSLEMCEGACYEIFEDHEEVKWYDHESDMAKFSVNYPSTLFILHGQGEEGDDAWIKYFKNGKMQACYGEIVYPPYDEKKLKIVEFEKLWEKKNET